MADTGTTTPLAPTPYDVLSPAKRVRTRPAWGSGAIGIGGILVLWSVLALTVFRDGGAVPTPWSVLATYPEDGWSFYADNASITLQGAAKGFLYGNALALALAALVLIIPPLEGLITQLAVVSYCMPLTAIGPIILVVAKDPRSATVFLAAISVFFTTLIGTLLGLRAAHRTSLDVVAAYGGGRIQQLLRVQVIAALPSVLAALKLAAPAAMLGAIIGEYLGGIDSGLGVALTASQQTFNVPRTWALMLLIGALAGLGFAAFSLIARFVTPWTSGSTGGSQ